MSEYDSFRDSKILGGLAAPGPVQGGVHFGSTGAGVLFDTAGYESLIVVADIVRSAGTYDLKIEHSDDPDSSVFHEWVPASQIIGAGPTVVDDGQLFNARATSVQNLRFGITSKKRYFRFWLGPSGASITVLANAHMVGFRSHDGPTPIQDGGAIT